MLGRGTMALAGIIVPYDVFSPIAYCLMPIA